MLAAIWMIVPFILESDRAAQPPAPPLIAGSGAKLRAAANLAPDQP